MTKFLSTLLLNFFVFFHLSSCSFIGDSNQLTIPQPPQNAAPLKTPAGMQLSFSTLYPISPNHYLPVKKANISPPGLYSNQKSANSQD